MLINNMVMRFSFGYRSKKKKKWNIAAARDRTLKARNSTMERDIRNRSSYFGNTLNILPNDT